MENKKAWWELRENEVPRVFEVSFKGVVIDKGENENGSMWMIVRDCNDSEKEVYNKEGKKFILVPWKRKIWTRDDKEYMYCEKGKTYEFKVRFNTYQNSEGKETCSMWLTRVNRVEM